MILRDADLSTAWNAQADALDARHYYCQNWRADVSVIIDDSAELVERVMYSPYGVPFGIPAGDFVTSATFAEPADGNVDGADSGYLLGAWGSGYDIADLDNDGDVDAADQTIMNNNWGNNLGWGLLSNHHNRLGYAGYVFDEALAGTKWHVRHRVLESVLGRWVRRDPLGYVDGMSVYAYTTNPISTSDPIGLQAVNWPHGCLDNCKGDPWVQVAMSYVNQQCGPKSRCQTWSITCWPNLPSAGDTNCGACAIRVDPAASCGTVAHELIHAGDNCAHGRCSTVSTNVMGDAAGDVSCDAWACTELRAIYYGCCASHQKEDPQLCFNRKIADYRDFSCGFALIKAHLWECCLGVPIGAMPSCDITWPTNNPWDSGCVECPYQEW